MKRYFLGLAANYKNPWVNLFAHGSRKDAEDLEGFLAKKYGGKAALTKNGRSALTLALKACAEPGDEILANGFTCYAVVEAIKAAKMKPVYVDISRKDLNFNAETLEAAITGATRPAAILVQNTLGNPIDIEKIEKFAKKHGLIIIEDLAHATGILYLDGREAGTVGAATVLSFGKEKSIDTVSGGAVVFRGLEREDFTNNRGREGIEARSDFPQRILKMPVLPDKRARISDSLRARFYPIFGAICRALTGIHLGGILMRILLKIHFVERSADSVLDTSRRPANFQAKLALAQLKAMKKSGEPPLRDFMLLENRDEVLAALKAQGYYFGGFWYERPVSPERYYKKVHFSEDECPVAVEVAKSIINLPKYYSKTDLEKAHQIIKKVGKPEETNEK